MPSHHCVLNSVAECREEPGSPPHTLQCLPTLPPPLPPGRESASRVTSFVLCSHPLSHTARVSSGEPGMSPTSSPAPSPNLPIPWPQGRSCDISYQGRRTGVLAIFLLNCQSEGVKLKLQGISFALGLLRL